MSDRSSRHVGQAATPVGPALWRNRLIVLAALGCLFVLHAWHFRNLLVDDAGISLAYARNLGRGDGLVSQPGVPPVEAFSNPSWVFVLAPMATLGLDLPSAVKPFSIVVSLASVAMLFWIAYRLLGSNLLALIVAGWTVVQPAFVIWSVSGLEAPLYVVSVLSLLILASSWPSSAAAYSAGSIAAIAALTRPEGIIYAVAYPIFHRRQVVRYSIPLLLIIGGYFIFRLSYFGAPLPNTYYMKMEGGAPWTAPGFWLSTMPAKLDGLALAAWGAPRVVVAALTLLSAGWLVYTRRLERQHLLVGTFLGISVSLFLVLPPDWMSEYRYATPVFPLINLFLVFCVATMWSSTFRLPIRALAGILTIYVVGVTVLAYIPRSIYYSHHPASSFYGFASRYSMFDSFARELGLKNASLLAADVGGLLYYSSLRIYDLGGLADATIARTMGKRHQDFYDYVFEGTRPTFIAVYSVWSTQARFDGDPRFRRDYIPIAERVDADMQPQDGLVAYSGEYVRRDVLPLAESLDRLRAMRR